MISSLSKTTLQKMLGLACLHCTTSERSGPFLHSMQHNFLSRPFHLRLDYCNALLDGLPSHNQTFTNDSECWHDWFFSEPKRPMYTFFISLHSLPVAAHIKYKTLMLSYRTTTGSARSNFHSLNNLHPLQKSEICG